MKVLLSIFFSFVFVGANAKIWRVNNNAGISADFTTLQAAHDGATSGDTLYIESSPDHYGSLISTKKLIIIGTGYFLAHNVNLQAFTHPSLVGHLNFNAGSAGSVVEGISTNGNSVAIYVNNITIRRNHFSTINGSNADYHVGGIYIYSSASNIVISQNFGVFISNSSPSTNILINNNYLAVQAWLGDGANQASITLHEKTVALIKNNIFRRGTVTTYNSSITNNILYNGFFSGADNLVANNIASGTQFGTANGNLANVSMASVFESTGSFDAFFKLKAGSPAIGAGYGSTSQNLIDAGIFGGANPYVLSGIPSIPTIYFLSNQPVGSNSDPIDVEVKVRSNN